MDSRQNWIIAALIAVLVGGCLCMVATACLAGTGLAIWQFVNIASTEVATHTPEMTITFETSTAAPIPEMTPSPSATKSAGEDPRPTQAVDIEADTLAQMEKIESQVIALRGLQPTGPVERSLLTPDELLQHVLDDLLVDYTPEDARDDALVLSLFGLLEPEFDLLSFYIELYNEQIAGFYDNELKQMFIVAGSGFGGIERMTYAHEYVHALQDQTYDIRYGLNYNDEACEEDSERCAAIQALLEGDATFLEEQWLRNYATAKDIADILKFFGDFKAPVYDSAPAFMREDFIFPYTYGASFVKEIHLKGGWAAVDKVYANPPISTEQILHPDRYPSDQPIILEPIDFAPVLGDGWREIEQNVLGEWYTFLVLAEYLDQEQASLAAEGWGGDFYVALHHDEHAKGALILLTVWDRVHEAEEFYSTFTEYGQRRFGQGSIKWNNATWSSTEGEALLERWGNQTLWILAPTEAQLELLRQALEFPYPIP